MNRTSLVILLASSMAATVGCASKNYVRQETTPLINKTNELDDLTAKNTNAIKDVDARAQAGIQEVTAKAADAVPIRVLLTQEIVMRVSYLKPICWPEGRTSLVFPTAPTQFNVGSLPSAPFVTLTVSPIFTVSFFQPPRMRA